MRSFLLILFTFCFAASARADNLQHQFERGIAAYKSGDYAMAGQKLKFVLKEHPNNLTALYYYGMSKHQLGTYRTAKQYLEYANQIAPDVPEIRVALTRLYIDMERFTDAHVQITALETQRKACGQDCEIAEPLEQAIESARAAAARAPDLNLEPF